MIRATIAFAAAFASVASTPSHPEIERFVARTPDGAVLGDVFVTSEVRRGSEERPVVFAFNGGPGAGSAWLGLGVLGSTRAALPDDPAAAVPARLDLVPNARSILGSADLVLIDPLGTGFSRARAGMDPAAAYAWRSDATYLAGVVRDWLRRHGRERSPVFLVGESYGTERAVAMADALTTGTPVRLRGVVLVSQSITVENTRQRPGNDLGTAIGVPTIAATACYLRLVRPSAPPQVCAERGYDWAVSTYLPALLRGGELTLGERSAVISQLAALSGLPRSNFERHGLVLTKEEYRRAALAERRQILGVYDTRYRAAIQPDRPAQDPSIDQILPPLTEATRRYYRERLGLSGSPVDGTPYVLLDAGMEARWRYGPKADPYIALDMMGVLARALRRGEARLMIAGGLYDTAGSYGADRYLASHIDLPAGRVTRASYNGGHMFYHDGAGRDAFVRDLEAFVAGRGSVR